MMQRKISEANKLQSGEMKEFQIDGISFLLIRHKEKFYATGNKCTHLGCKLVKGTLENNHITCPCHGSTFDITNGKVIKWISNWPKLIGSLTKSIGLAHPLTSYKIEIKDDDVYIDL